MDDTDPSRRSFLSSLLSGTLLTAAAGAVGSIVAYLFPPEEALSGLGPQRVKVGNVRDLNAGEGKLVLVDDEPVWVVRSATGYTALSAICTHKGCVIKWEGKRSLFTCPCHEGLFDAKGNVVGGLPRSSLPRFRVGVVADEIYVSRFGDRVV